MKATQILVLGMVLALGSGTPVRTVSAQASVERDAASIDVAIAAYLKSSLPSSGVVLEPRVRAKTGEWSSSRSPARNTALVVALGGSFGRRDSVFACGIMPSDCTLKGNTLLIFSDPSIDGDHATVYLQRLDRSGFKRIPVVRKDIEIKLERQQAGWRVTSSTVAAIT
ncbi:MAG: hypothetical protein JWM95_3994 [Gemmatimonadetes bacterium]|nr:hypothetical protein [Gemmatimonadota bacterium]